MNPDEALKLQQELDRKIKLIQDGGNGNFCGSQCTVCGGAGSLCRELLILRIEELEKHLPDDQKTVQLKGQGGY